jgi:hypothetical protein
VSRGPPPLGRGLGGSGRDRDDDLTDVLGFAETLEVSALR